MTLCHFGVHFLAYLIIYNKTMATSNEIKSPEDILLQNEVNNKPTTVYFDPPTSFQTSPSQYVYVAQSRPNITRVQLESERKSEARQVLMTYLGMWLLFEVITLAFLLTYLILPTFAFIQGSQSCSIVNPVTGTAQSRYYLQVYTGGFSSNSQTCTNTANNFCIRWDDETAWDRFDDITSYIYATSLPNTQSTISSAAALVPCAVFFLLIATLIHGYLVFKPTGHHSVKSAIWFYHIATWSLLLSWILAIAAQSEILYAPPFVPSLWTAFFRQGYGLDYLISPNVPVVSPTAEQRAALAGCSVALGYEGGTWLSVSVGILFFLIWFSIIAGCCLYPVLLTAAGESPN